ncbi:MAG: tRNA (cytidine(34)-2'-O)-methyltransferase [Planctomycetaceae bacterium]|nr:tRNA (cytidine(34)-2'-O)-methyltransferase [Planctomycetaceae bacterium]
MSSPDLPLESPPEPLLHVVLHQPEIPQNTGNIGRTCVAVGARLWLVRPLGFRVDERHLRRAAMDYWQYLDWEAVEDWPTVEQRLPGRTVWCLTKTATRPVWEATFSPGDVLLFGSESRGLPASIRQQYRPTSLMLPMRPEVRSLNLASTVNTVVYEAVRQFGGLAGAGEHPEYGGSQ